MFALAVCSVQFSVHPVPPGHIVEIHKRIKDALMFGDKPCSSHIQTGNRHFTRLITLIRDLQKYGIAWILTHPLSSHVWRIGSICSLEQHNR